MKGILLALLVCVAEAHIIFKHAPLSCDPILPAFQGCLRGQRCSRHGQCESSHRPEDEIQPPQLDTTVEVVQRDSEIQYAPGKCRGGAGEGEAGVAVDCFMKHPSHPIDDGDVTQKAARPYLRRPFWRPHFRPKPTVDITGTNRVKLPASTASATPTSTIQPQPSEPSSPTGNVTTDGTCGSSRGDTVCGDWSYGPCCSPYGVRTSSFYYSMMAILMPNGKVVFADKIENYTELILPNGQFAYSSEYDPVTNEVVALEYKTNAFCAGGTVLADGRALSVGGNGPLNFIDPTVKDGFKGIRYLERKFDDPKGEEGWIEPGHTLSTARWYPSVQTMPDGKIFVASGSLNGLNPTNSDNNNPTYEILDREGYPHGDSVVMSILEKNQPYYMYPFLHLLKDGNLFVFVSKSAQIFNVETDTIVKTLPDLRGDFRTYPNTGGSVMFPLSSANGWDPEIMICGGGAYPDINSPTDASCGRIKPLSENPTWEVESMPSGRVMVEGTLLPDGTIIWLNGCSRGAQGFGIAKDPVYDPWIYNPRASNVERWAVGGSSTIARMYHSVALLLLDGTVMVAGSNPVEQPVLVPNPKDPKTAYVTEFRVEVYIPHYLSGKKADQRPLNVVLSSRHLVANSGNFTVKFNVHKEAIELQVVLYQGGFVTHSLHMGHRMLYLDHTGWKAGQSEQVVEVTMPPDSNVAPPGAYVIYIVVDGVPSMGQFVMVENPMPPGDKPKGDKLNGKQTGTQGKPEKQQPDKPEDNKKIENGGDVPKNDTSKDDKFDKGQEKQGTDGGKEKGGGKEEKKGKEDDKYEEDDDAMEDED
ncbi:uncharacterized protein ARB_07376 [Trichophyton benhamiae CBS 112371]|uniref:Glyoxal oxidase n=1 Tax=Arthroderma benhamiae (strain ATCC MYA-4681 / CBS 112371) TaxID=663331 RepID=D4AT12_ARTBC|nr:uncharacterized protein ARB_07376 [Trichophyton benhamiae CBS 112371]EFE33912.1 hypothetical protein ARB_07376 [Trichophyton benhamiae CBS 112371]